MRSRTSPTVVSYTVDANSARRCFQSTRRRLDISRDGDIQLVRRGTDDLVVLPLTGDRDDVAEAIRIVVEAAADAVSDAVSGASAMSASLAEVMR